MAKKDAGDFSQNWADRLVAVLRRRAGHHLADAELRAGVKPGYLRKAQSASVNVMMRKFLRICAEAQIEPGEIFAEVFPKTDYDPDFGLPVPNSPLPKIVKMARQHLEQSPMFPVVDDAWLEWLDELRYDDPARAAQIAEEVVMSVGHHDIPQLLGIWASACRLIARYDEGFLALREALLLARQDEDRLTEADLLRRGASLVVSSSASYSVALSIVEQSASLYARSGEIDHLGRCLVSQGLFLIYLERRDEAEASFKTALSLLDERSYRDRIAAYQLSGLIANDRGEPATALTLASKALSLASSRYEVGKVHWLRASALAGMGEWLRAHRAFEEASLNLVKVAPIDAALCACDHVRLLISNGHLSEARLCIAAMRSLMEPLAENLIASAAIRDLVRSEREGRDLDRALILRIVERIEESRRVSARRQ